MIGFLRGKIDTCRFGLIYLDVNGVGYKVNVPPQIKIEEPAVGKNIKLYIHENIREDAYDLYGFLEYFELELFQKLLSVNGVGPRAAMAIMSASDSDKIIQAIESDDLTFFVSIPGIGKKVATKIILDLKSKISLSQSESILSKSGESDNIVEALVSLGYQKVEVQKIIHKMPKDLAGDQEKIRWVLKEMGKN
jgi:Holliday junction DNA helicase RuvA